LPIKKRHRADCIVDRVKYEVAQAKNKRKFLPRSVVIQFLNALKGSADPLYYEVALFQLGTGTRIGEACAMDWSDVNFESGTAYIHSNVCWSRLKGRPTFISPLTKTSEARLVSIPQAVLHQLKQLSLRSGRAKGLVFSHDGFKPLEYRSIQYHYDRILKGIGSEWRGTHIMRHSFSTDYLEKTKNPKALQGQLGHRTAEQTSHYAKITDMMKQDGMADYDKSFSELATVLDLTSVNGRC